MVGHDPSLMARVRANFTLRTQDNAHWHRIAALGVALEELKVHGREYATQVVRNAQALAAALDGAGVPVRFPELGYTRSHQLHIDLEGLKAKLGLTSQDLAKRLEARDIIVDAMGRLGTQELTRLGAREEHMARVADLVARAARGKKVIEEVHELRAGLGLTFCDGQ